MDYTVSYVMNVYSTNGAFAIILKKFMIDIDNNLRDVFFMRQAIGLAKKAEELGEVSVGAIAVLNNIVISEGHNCPIDTNDPTAHAEIVALRRASEKILNYRLLGVTLYVTLEPCIMCVGAMLHARIDRLVYGARDPRTGSVTSVYKLLDEKTLLHKIKYKGDILAEECGKLLTDFFQKRRL